VVSIAGNYLVTVTGANGCTAMGQALVMADLTPPALSVSASNLLNCQDSSSLLSANVSSLGSGIVWTGPGAFVAVGA
jgi:hypothetical protein